LLVLTLCSAMQLLVHGTLLLLRQLLLWQAKCSKGSVSKCCCALLLPQPLVYCSSHVRHCCIISIACCLQLVLG
jgi:hypothetical protein